jgi:DNA-binding protein H-NS
MALNLEALSPKDLQALIADAQSQMHTARANQIQEVRKKIDALLHNNGLTLADAYPTRGGAKAGKKFAVAPKYQNPSNHEQTWSGRGKRPFWFVEALKRRGVTADSLLIAGASKAAAPAKTAAKKATKKVVKKAVGKVARKAAKKSSAKTAAKKAAKR